MLLEAYAEAGLVLPSGPGDDAPSLPAAARAGAEPVHLGLASALVR